jgi:multidrug efflux pump subunit AcrA (membrane-fusion protein)
MFSKNKFYSMVAIWFILSLILAGCANISLPGQATPTPEPELVEDFVPVASATGELVPFQQSTLSMSTSGVIEEVLVSEGDEIKAGQVIARLKGSERLQAAISTATLELTNANQALEDLYDDPEVRRAEAQLALAEAEKALDKAQDRRLSKEFTHGDQDLIDIAAADLVLANQRVEDRQKDFDEDGIWRAEDDLIRANLLSQLAAAKDERDRILANVNYLKALPDEYERNISDGELEVAKARLEAAQQEWKRLRDDGLDEDAIALAEERIRNAEAQLSAAQAELKDLELAAPFDGTVTKLYINANEWVTPGMPITLLAELKNLRVETTDLNEIDVAQVEIGDKVIVTFDAIPDTVITGTVVYIAPKASEGSGVNYTVTIELEELPEKLLWGMTAFVDIEID